MARRFALALAPGPQWRHGAAREHGRRRRREARGGRGPAPCPLPVVRQRRHGARQGVVDARARGPHAQRHRPDGGDERDERARPPAARAGHGARRRGSPRARPRHVPRAAVRAAHRRDARRPARAVRRSGARRPARLPAPHDRAPRRTRRLARGRLRERVRARHAGRGRRVRPGRLEPLLLDDRHDRLAGLRRRARRRAGGAGHPARAVLRRARPRSAGDLHRPPPGAARRRRADPRARDDPWGGGPARARRVAGAEAVAGGRRQRLPHPLLAEGRGLLAGVLAHLPALCGLTAPSFNSYHRIVPQYWAGAFTCWGHDNREAPLRLPSLFWGMEEASTNVELKAPDATSNPYLAVGGLIAAGLDGLGRGLEPPEPVEVDPATLSDDDRARLGIAPLPSTQEEALDALAADAVLTGALGPVLAESYLAVRRSEWEAYSAEDEAFEQ